MRRYRIGRAESNDIVLVQPTVSREHADLTELGPGRFNLRDLGSTYGTSVQRGADWSLITAAEVHGDTPVRIGEFDTTVADLLRAAKPAPVRHEPRRPPPWAAPAPRLSDRARARHPETTHIAWGPTTVRSAAYAEVAASRPPRSAPAAAGRALPQIKGVLVAVLARVGAILIVGLVALLIALAVDVGLRS